MWTKGSPCWSIRDRGDRWPWPLPMANDCDGWRCARIWLTAGCAISLMDYRGRSRGWGGHSLAASGSHRLCSMRWSLLRCRCHCRRCAWAIFLPNCRGPRWTRNNDRMLVLSSWVQVKQVKFYCSINSGDRWRWIFILVYVLRNTYDILRIFVYTHYLQYITYIRITYYILRIFVYTYYLWYITYIRIYALPIIYYVYTYYQ